MILTIQDISVSINAYQIYSPKTGKRYKKPKILKEPSFTLDVKLMCDRALILGAQYYTDNGVWFSCTAVDKEKNRSILVNHKFTGNYSFQMPRRFILENVFAGVNGIGTSNMIIE